MKIAKRVVLALLFLMFTQLSFAQTPPPPPPPEATLDKIVVTGTTLGDALGTTGNPEPMGFLAWLVSVIVNFFSVSSEPVPPVPLFTDLIKNDK